MTYTQKSLESACFLFESGAEFPREKGNPLVKNYGHPEHSDVTMRIKSHIFLELPVVVPLIAISPLYRGLMKRVSPIKFFKRKTSRNDDNFREPSVCTNPL